MFRNATIIGLLATIIFVVLHVILSKRRNAHGAAIHPLRWWEKFICMIAFTGLLAMGVTGLLSVLLYGTGKIGGWVLWYHLAAAPVFIFGIVAFAYMWAELSRFGNAPVEKPSRFDPLTAIIFWIIVTSAFVAITVMLLSMVPIFPSESQHTLVAIHRWAALLLTLSMIVHGYRVLVWSRKVVKTTETAPAATAA